MNSFKYKDREITFSIVRGKVINYERFVNSELYSKGLNHTITNSVTQQIWILKESGEEESFRFADSDIPVMVGQFISIIFISNIRNDKRTLASIVINHNAKKHWTVAQKSHMKVESPRYNFGIIGWSLIIIPLSGWLAFNWPILPAIISFLFFMAKGTKYNISQSNAMQKEFNEHLSKIISSELERPDKFAPRMA